MGSSRLFPAWIILLCLSAAPLMAAAPAKEEVPQGYEDAGRAEEKVSRPQPAPKANRGPAVQVSGKPRPVPPAKAKREVVPQGYEDAPQPGKNAPVAAAAAPVVVLAPVANAPGNVDARVKQLEQQYRPQFQQMLNSELAFIRRACDLDQSQRETAAKAGQRCMSSILRQCAVAQHEMERGQNRGVVIVGGAVQPNCPPGPRKLLREQLAEIAGKSLRPEQIERYRRESKERDASRKRAVVCYMVARADQTLVLSVEQREKLVLALTDNYSDAWERTISIWRNNPQFIPSIPDSQIVPLLSENQKTVWRRIQKMNFGVSMSMDVQMDSGMAVIKE